MKLIKFFLAFLVICIFTMFATSNLQKVPVNFLTSNQSLIGYDTTTTPAGQEMKTPREVPVFVIIYASFALGFFVSWFLALSGTRIMKKRLKNLNHKLQEYEKELNSLRNLPLSNSDEQVLDNTAPLPISGNDSPQ